MDEIPEAPNPRSSDKADPASLDGKTLDMETDVTMERLATLLVVNCFRNTVLEDYHSEGVPITDERMKVLMKEAVNKLHTALHALFTGDQPTREATWELLNRWFPQAWDKPEFDQGMLRAIEFTKQEKTS